MNKEPQHEMQPEESLRLIRSMIDKTKLSLSDSSHIFLLWGYAVVLGSIIQFVLKYLLNYEKHYLAWLIIPPTLLVHFIFVYRMVRKQRVSTFISDANAYLWQAVGISFFAVVLICSKIGMQYSFPFYILLYGIGTFVSGSLLQFKPLKYGGVICFVLALATSHLPYDAQILMNALALTVSYIIPGHLLRHHFKTNFAA